MAKTEFKFLERYRIEAPEALREVVEAREKALLKLDPLIQDMDMIYDLCRISFQLPFDRNVVADWFERAIKEEDNIFSLDIDRAEAALVATLALRKRISTGTAEIPFACLVLSYCGKRAPGDGGSLLAEARDALDVAGNERRIVLADKKIAMPAGADLSARLEAAESGFNGATVRATIDAVSSDLRDSGSKLGASVHAAIASLTSDARRLAEEVDMLWWYIGDWSKPLDKPRTALEPSANAVASAVELGGIVREIPGPHGVYGILRRTLGSAADSKTSLRASIERIGADGLARMTRPLQQAIVPLLPVQAAINLCAERGVKDCAAPLKALLGDVPEMEVSYFELAVQLFRERVLIGCGSLEQ